LSIEGEGEIEQKSRNSRDLKVRKKGTSAPRSREDTLRRVARIDAAGAK
jgi:hypothetical protein